MCQNAFFLIYFIFGREMLSCINVKLFFLTFGSVLKFYHYLEVLRVGNVLRKHPIE